MRYVKQIGIILGITLAGEILNHVVPLPVLMQVLHALSLYHHCVCHGEYNRCGLFFPADGNCIPNE